MLLLLFETGGGGVAGAGAGADDANALRQNKHASKIFNAFEYRKNTSICLFVTGGGNEGEGGSGARTMQMPLNETNTIHLGIEYAWRRHSTFFKLLDDDALAARATTRGGECAWIQNNDNDQKLTNRK